MASSAWTSPRREEWQRFKQTFADEWSVEYGDLVGGWEAEVLDLHRRDVSYDDLLDLAEIARGEGLEIEYAWHAFLVAGEGVAVEPKTPAARLVKEITSDLGTLEALAGAIARVLDEHDYYERRS
jgi:hypothetical protein